MGSEKKDGSTFIHPWDLTASFFDAEFPVPQPGKWSSIFVFSFSRTLKNGLRTDAPSIRRRIATS